MVGVSGLSWSPFKLSMPVSSHKRIHKEGISTPLKSSRCLGASQKSRSMTLSASSRSRCLHPGKWLTSDRYLHTVAVFTLTGSCLVGVVFTLSLSSPCQEDTFCLIAIHVLVNMQDCHHKAHCLRSHAPFLVRSSSFTHKQARRR
jgi:hypothetical protein